LLVTIAVLTASPDAAPAAEPEPPPAQRAPIPVHFRLDRPAFVTLVIERVAAVEPDSALEKPDKAADKVHYAGRPGLRVKNLVSNTWFAAGQHTLWWDGLDESNTRLVHIPGKALYYRIDGSLVSAGEYRVRGLTRQAVTPKYEFAVYSGGQRPPWKTKDGRGGWLADHTPPAAALFLPAASNVEKGVGPGVLLSSPVSEAGDGLVLCDLEGRRVSGTRTIGAGDGWVGAELLARDVSTRHARNQDVYLAVDWLDRAEVWALGPINHKAGHSPSWGGKRIFTYTFSRRHDWAVGGLAARDGRVVLSLPKLNQVLLIDAAKGTLLGKTEVKQPRGLAFDAGGRLFVLSGRRVTAWDVAGDASRPRLTLSDWRSSALFEDPQGIALDDHGRIYVSDWGKSHQVKVLAPDGKLVRAIGRPGEPRVGPYDPKHMNHPKGLTVTSDGRLWVAEHWLVPKRVSIWTQGGEFVKAMYGPTWYGGGGALDPRDRTRFFVHGDGGGMEFKLDWDRGTSELKRVYYLPNAPVDLLEYKLAGKVPPTKSFPQTPVWVGKRLYLSNCFAGDPTNGEAVVYLWHYRNGIAVPVATLGDPADAAWDILRTEPFRSRWPAGVRPPESGRSVKTANATFVWCDLNDDGEMQPDEVQIVAGPPGSVTLDGELGLTTSTAIRYAPVGFTAKGAPRYDLARGKELAAGGQPGGGSGGQVIAARDGWTVFTLAPRPLPGCYLAGSKDGRLNWTFPEDFLGLQASHHSKPPRHPGEVIGTTRLLGRSFLAPRTPLVLPASKRGNTRGVAEPIELWAINGNYGNVYLFTTDGLLVATLFRDSRSARPWPNEGRRGFDAKDVSLEEECFFPSIQQMTDGRVYLVAGKSFSGIFEVTGLDTLRRVPEQRLTVTAEDVAAARRYLEARGKAQEEAGPRKGTEEGRTKRDSRGVEVGGRRLGVPGPRLGRVAGEGHAARPGPAPGLPGQQGPAGRQARAEAAIPYPEEVPILR
jgi:hypothetical protein